MPNDSDKSIKAKNGNTAGHMVERKAGRIAVLGWNCSAKATGNTF